MDSFPLGQVPAQSLRSGDSLTLTLTPSGDGVRPLRLQVDPEPKGKLVLDPDSGRLCFEPAPEDRGEFVLTIGDGEGTGQEFPILVRPLLPPNFSVIPTGGTAPDPSSSKYVAIDEQPAGKAILNRTQDYRDPEKAEVQTYTVAVSGVVLTLDPKAEDYALAPYAERTDVAAYHIYADELIVRGPIVLPGAQLHVHARVLRMQDNGAQIASFDTSPHELIERSSQHAANQGEAGGDIYLHVQQLDIPEGAAHRFIARGARGQAARPGEAAPDGGDVQPWDGRVATKTQWGGTETLNWDIAKDILPHTGQRQPIAVEVYEYRAGHSQGIVTQAGSWRPDGPPLWPGAAKKPKRVPGGPGSGGRGGDLYTLDIERLGPLVQLPVGAVGEPAEDLPGAVPGNPRRSCYIEVSYDSYFANVNPKGPGDGQLNRRRAGVHMIQAVDLEPQPLTQAPKFPVTAVTEDDRKPRAGELRELPGGAGSWLHPVLVRALTRYVSDTHMAEAGALALDRAAPYREALALITPGSAIELEAAGLDLLALIRQIEGPFDYFGKPAGWVPMLSFEASLSLYEKEVPAAIRAMYLGYWLEKNQSQVRDASATLREAIVSLRELRDRARLQHDAAERELLSLRPQLQTLRETEAGLQADIDATIKTLEAEASGLRVEDALRGAAKVLGGVLQALPVGQPVTGIIGSATTVVAGMDFDDPASIVTESVGFVLEQALDQAAAAKDKKTALFTPPDGVDLGDDEELEKSLATKRIEARSGAGLAAHKQAVSTIRGGLESFCVSDETVQKRLDEALATDPALAAKRAKLEQHNQTKAKLSTQIFVATQTMEDAYADFLNAELGIFEMRHQLSQASKRLNLQALQHVQALARGARDRLTLYMYRLVRSANYQMVRAFPMDTQAQFMFDAFTEMLATSEGGVLSEADFQTAKVAFEAALKTITDPILDHYNEHPLSIDDTITVTLEAHQLAALNRPQGRAIIDLARMGSLDEASEDIRILGIRTKEAKVEGLPEDTAVNLHLEYRHSGVSQLRSGGRLLVFRAGEFAVEGDLGRTPYLNDRMLWGSTVTYHRDSVETKDRQPSPTDQSWLGRLVGGHANADMALQYQAAAWSELRIQRSVTPNRFNLKLTALTLEIDLNVKGLGTGLSTLSVQCAPGISPLILVSRQDLSERADGHGSFLRTYDSRTVRQVTLRAPRYLGSLRFLGWLEVKGASKEELSKPMPLLSPEHLRLLREHGDGHLVLEPEVRVDMSYHQVMIPVYGPASVLD